MNIYKKLFKTTLIYGIATVLPKMIGFIMARYHIDWLPENAYADYTVLFAWFMFFNVVLSFGMETAFFRFYNKYDNKKEVINNTLWFLMMVCGAFYLIAQLFKEEVDAYLKIDPMVVSFFIWILILDALAVIPFAKLRADEKPLKYSLIKVGNVVINAVLTVVFLYIIPHHLIPKGAGWISEWYIPHFEVGYIFLSNLIASGLTLLVLMGAYRNLSFQFNWKLQKEMLVYAFPVMVGGLGFVVNEAFDKILLRKLLPEDIREIEVASYGAIYKIGVFMVLFRMAYSLGIEPFFFSYAKNKDAQIKYATITKYFVIFGSLAMLLFVVTADIIKRYYIPNQNYWHTMKVVPYIILANFMLGIYTNLSVWYKLQDKTSVGAYLSIGGAIVTIVFNIILIPIWGVVGSAVTTLLAYAFMMLVSFYLGQKKYPIPYDIPSIGLFLGTSIGLSFLYFYQFRENYVIGFLFIILFVTLIFWKEKAMLTQILSKKLRK